MPNHKGQWTLREVEESGKPLYDFRRETDIVLPENTFTYSELIELCDIKLSKEERMEKIIGFKITSYTRGCIPLYRLDDCI